MKTRALALLAVLLLPAPAWAQKRTVACTPTAAGDLCPFDGTSSFVPVSVGADGTVPIADHTQPGHFAWGVLVTLPSQSGHGGQFLTTDGSSSTGNASWHALTINTTSGQLTGGGALTGTLTLGLATTGATAGSYPLLAGSVDQYGRFTAVTTATPTLQTIYGDGGSSSTGQVIQLTTGGQGVVVDVHGAALGNPYPGYTASSNDASLALGVIDSTKNDPNSTVPPLVYGGWSGLGYLLGRVAPGNAERQNIYLPSSLDTIFMQAPLKVGDLRENGNVGLIGGSTNLNLGTGTGGDFFGLAGNGVLGGGAAFLDAGETTSSVADEIVDRGVAGGVFVGHYRASRVLIGRTTSSQPTTYLGTTIYGGAANGISLLSDGAWTAQASAMTFLHSDGVATTLGTSATDSSGITIQAGSSGIFIHTTDGLTMNSSGNASLTAMTATFNTIVTYAGSTFAYAFQNGGVAAVEIGFNNSFNSSGIGYFNPANGAYIGGWYGVGGASNVMALDNVSDLAPLSGEVIDIGRTQAWRDFYSSGFYHFGHGQTTVGAAGAASPLPGAPARWIEVVGDNGVHYVVPGWPVS